MKRLRIGLLLLALLFMIAAGMVVCDERCSRMVDEGAEGFVQAGSIG